MWVRGCSWPRRRGPRALQALTVALLAESVDAQPPFMPGLMLISNDLPDMPIAITESGADGQFCAFACLARSDCFGFNFVPPGCKASLSCPHAGGCCWLKASASSSNMTTAPQCVGSFIMRASPDTLPPTPSPSPAPRSAKNVLYILVDDMRPDVAPYGQSWMHTPSVQALAAAGVTFSRAYCTIAVCSPSRMSFLTGRWPHHTLTWNFVNHFRQATCREMPDQAHDAGPEVTYRKLPVYNGGAAQCCSFCTADADLCVGWTYHKPTAECRLHNATRGYKHSDGDIAGHAGTLHTRNWTSLPQHFTNSGYLTLSSGKIFHTEEGGDGPAPWDGPGTGMPPLQDPPSWSRLHGGNFSMANVNALAPMRPCSSYSSESAAGGDGCSVASATLDGGVPDGTFKFCDRIIRDDAVGKLRAAAANRNATGQPFFMAVGFRKPHLPFRHPGPWDQFYPAPEQVPLATYKTLDPSQPPIAFHQTSIAQNPYSPLPDIDAGTLRRDYYAAISWMDWNLGQVLNELESLGLTQDTLIVFHSDHGWSLGEHGEWEKFTNFEHGTRVPLIVSAPWIPGAAGTISDEVVQLIDVFPTMAELAGVPVPDAYDLDGVSVAPLIFATGAASTRSHEVQPPAEVPSSPRGYALSVYPRCPSDTKNASNFWRDNDCMMVERSSFPFMGVSIRTEDWRYTEWVSWNASALAPELSGSPVAIELYSHAGDNGTTFDGPWEVQNLAGQPQYAQVQQQLAALLREAYPAGPAWPSSAGESL